MAASAALSVPSSFVVGSWTKCKLERGLLLLPMLPPSPLDSEVDTRLSRRVRYLSNARHVISCSEPDKPKRRAVHIPVTGHFLKNVDAREATQKEKHERIPKSRTPEFLLQTDSELGGVCVILWAGSRDLIAEQTAPPLLHLPTDTHVMP